MNTGHGVRDTGHGVRTMDQGTGQVIGSGYTGCIASAWAALLHGACEGWAALLLRPTTGGKPVTKWHRAGVLPTALPNGDAWLSVATFRDPRQRLADLAWVVPGAWVDVDPPKEADGADLVAWRARALDVVRAFGPAPTVIVDSGRGFHAYWLFVAVARLDGPDRARVGATIAAVNRALVGRLGGDSAATDLARVMRLPGTRNPKPGGGACVVVSTDGPRYRLVDLEAELLATHTVMERIHAPGRPGNATARPAPLPGKAARSPRGPGRPALGVTLRDLRALPPWARDLVVGGAWRAGRRYCVTGTVPDRSRADLAAVGAMVRAGWPDARIMAAYLRDGWLIGARFRELRDREGSRRADVYLARTIARARQAPDGGTR